jgi:hypothetical protein
MPPAVCCMPPPTPHPPTHPSTHPLQMNVELESLEAWHYKRSLSYLGTALDITDFRPDRELGDLI